MKPPAALAAFAALTVAVAATIAPAFAARSSYVIDDAHMLSAGAIAQINAQVGTLAAQTGKEVVVVTTPSLNGVAPNTAVRNSFSQLQVNGVEIFIAKADRQIQIQGDAVSAQFFPTGSFQPIVQSMTTSFKAGDFDGGVENAVSLIVNTYRGHESSLNAARKPVTSTSSYGVQRTYSRGWNMGWIWWIIILAVIFFVIRGIFRAIAGPRMYGPGPGYGGPGYGGPGYGGPGYGGGYGGGGGFWSGLLGGLGGAFLGNEIFGNRGGFGGDGGVNPGGGVDNNAADAGGWQNDAGQIDSSNSAGGSWGDSGGGGWGGGDSGGGFGGGDSGGGGGDSGGGW